VERIYVHQDVYTPFLELLAAKVRALRVGPDIDYAVDLGAMTTSGQIELVEQHIDDALAKGAAIFARSEYPKKGPGQFLPATILVDVDHSMDVMKHETFGPVLGVMKVESMQQAVDLANDSYLGLTGSVWSKNRKSAELLARQVKAGVIMINDHLMSHGLAETPWGGFKQSGVGRTHGEIGFAEMTQAQCIVHDYMPGVQKNMWWHPHSLDVYLGLRGLLDLLYGQRFSRRVKGLRQLLKIFPRTFKA
jgi:succinate-semialdehyde dehydrogenase/glutarate-semialdehyde dehydrogenase